MKLAAQRDFLLLDSRSYVKTSEHTRFSQHELKWQNVMHLHIQNGLKGYKIDHF